MVVEDPFQEQKSQDQRRAGAGILVEGRGSSQQSSVDSSWLNLGAAVVQGVLPVLSLCRHLQLAAKAQE